MKRLNDVFGFFLIILLSVSSARADFVLVTQNSLHLGYRSSAIGADYIPAKYNYLSQNIVAQADITLIQEVMRQADPTQFLAGYTHWPRTAVAGAWPNLKGFNRYKEAYLMLARTYVPAAPPTPASGIEVHCYIQLQNPIAVGSINLIRPPDMYLVRNATAGTYTWLLNFHAIWGKRVERTAEANSLANFVNTVALVQTPNAIATSAASAAAAGCAAELPVVNRVVIAGDWNLNQASLQAYFPVANYHVQPAADTSLTTVGNLSRSYDHIIWTTNVVATVAPAVFNPAAGGNPVAQPACPLPPANAGPYCGFRKHISDHLGVTVTIQE